MIFTDDTFKYLEITEIIYFKLPFTNSLFPCKKSGKLIINIPVLGFSCGAESFKALTYRIPFDIKNESKLVFLCSFIKECFKNKNIERSRRLKNWNIFFESFVWKILLL